MCAEERRRLLWLGRRLRHRRLQTSELLTPVPAGYFSKCPGATARRTAGNKHKRMLKGLCEPRADEMQRMNTAVASARRGQLSAGRSTLGPRTEPGSERVPPPPCVSTVSITAAPLLSETGGLVEELK